MKDSKPLTNDKSGLMDSQCAIVVIERAWKPKCPEKMKARHTMKNQTTSIQKSLQTSLQAVHGKETLRRGDIYYADLNGLEHARGSEQTGRRPVLIIQNDIANCYAPTTIIAILTTKRKRRLPTHVLLRDFAGLNRQSIVCLEQIKTIDKSRLEEYKGNIGSDAMKEIEKAMAVSLGMICLRKRGA